jgi:hypothetical protein
VLVQIVNLARSQGRDVQEVQEEAEVQDEWSKWFAPCEKLGIAADHGYFTR